MMRVVLLLIFSICLTANNAICRDSLFQKGVAELSLNNYEQARINFLSDVEKKPSFVSFYNLGVATGNLENWSEARWAFESALKYNLSSDKAQFNAQFATQQMDETSTWTHPYPWTDRLVLSFGYNLWLILALASSIALGVLAFLYISKRKIAPGILKWLNRTGVIAVILLLFSLYGLYQINSHFNTPHYAILKTDKTLFFISPNGIELDVEVPKGNRMSIVKESKNEWLLLQVPDRDQLWVKSEQVLKY